MAQDILLSVSYTCKGTPVIKWKHTSTRGTTKIAEWKSGNYTNIASNYENRVTVYENGSLQLLNVAMRDSGYYLVTVMEEFGTTMYGTVLLSVYGMRSDISIFLLSVISPCFCSTGKK